jgi:hypothetical protein
MDVQLTVVDFFLEAEGQLGCIALRVAAGDGSLAAAARSNGLTALQVSE